MKVGLVSDSLSTTAGGIFEIERSLALRLRALGVSVTAWGVRDEAWENVSGQWGGIECRLRERFGPRIFGFVPGLVSDLVGSECELLHLQHLWMYPSFAVHRWHGRTGRPYLVTANGMLEPWTLSRSKWIKRAAAIGYENRMLRSAACLQANTEKEAADFRAYGLRNPICRIPNGVDLPEVSDSHPLRERRGGPRVLLFLGRLHPKKGLVNALRAWAEVMGHGARNVGLGDWQFVIAGWDQGGHGDELKALCRELGLDYSEKPSDTSGNSDTSGAGSAPRVIFYGPVFGREKDVLMRTAEAFILPSFSEGLPMAVLEAWAYGLPVLMTDHCNLPEGFAGGAAIRISTEVPGIAEGIRELFEGSFGDLEAMGEAGRALVEGQFTWPKVAAQMKEVYEWMLGGGTPPGCLC
jgi:poly(glycerol-phosphate) alpha-glucosyltransferase